MPLTYYHINNNTSLYNTHVQFYMCILLKALWAIYKSNGVHIDTNQLNGQDNIIIFYDTLIYNSLYDIISLLEYLV